VSELAAALEMSYMGVKGHCAEMERDGYLARWRRPGGVGRPEVVYRLTQKAHALFPESSNRMTLEALDAANLLFGATAAERILYRMWRGIEEAYAPRVRGETPDDRARWLARLRDADGYMAEWARDDEGRARVTEFHSPVLDLLSAHPAIGEYEREMFGRLIGAPVRRTETRVAGQYRCTFEW
jgi:predicted ArsR family transcriptional regulator